MRFLVVLLLNGFLFTSLLFGQDAKTTTSDNYVEKCKSSFNLTAAYKIDFMHLALFDDNSKRQFNYYPNLRGVMSLGAKYKIFSLSYAFNILDSDIFDVHYGQSSLSDLRFGIKSRSFWMNFYYEKYKGFFLSEEQLWFPPFQTDSVYYRNHDLSSMKFGLEMTFIRNNNFSKAAAFEYTEIQKKSAGAVLLNFKPEFSNINSKSIPLIPVLYQPYYSDLSKFDKTSFLSFAFGLGYGHALVAGPLNFSNAISAGPHMQMYFFDGFKIRFPYELQFKSSLSVNFKHFYAGALAGLDINNNYFKDNIIRKQGVHFLFRAGFRFYDI